MANVAEIVKADAASSDNRWEGAIDSAERDGDSAAKSRWEKHRADCENFYDSAIEAIEAGDLDRAEAWLERCNELESEAGDNADAHHALQSVRAAVVTSEQIEALSDDAGVAGDLSQVALCAAALAGDAEARKQCERVIREARANAAD